MFEIAEGDLPGFGVVATGRVFASGDVAASGDAVLTVPVAAELSVASAEDASLLSVASAELLLAVFYSVERDAVAVADALADVEDAGVSGVFSAVVLDEHPARRAVNASGPTASGVVFMGGTFQASVILRCIDTSLLSPPKLLVKWDLKVL